MKVSTRKITREDFVKAINKATEVINELHPDTRLAFNCEKFIDLNKKVMKDHQKKLKEKTQELQLDLDCYKASKCVEKDGKLQKDKEGHYEYSAAGEQAVLKKQIEIQNKISEIAEEFLAEEVLVKCIIDEVKLPEKIAFDTTSSLNTFAYKNKPLFEDSIEEVEGEQA